MSDITKRLFALRDEEYARFQAKLTPTVPPESFIGVRVPLLRRLAKELAGTPEAAVFLEELPHRYYDETMLHGLLIAEIRDYARCLAAVERFLPYVDNWAVCDILSPRVFRRHKPELIDRIREWAASPLPYSCRFGIEMLMSHFLDEAFCPAYLEIPAAVRREHYYVRMMVAWFYATALAKQWDATLPYLEGRRLERWIHNKTIQKACESYRITPEQKTALRSLRRGKEEDEP